MTRLYRRRVIISAGGPVGEGSGGGGGGAAVEGTDRAESVVRITEDLRVAFQVAKPETREPNTCEVTISNLAKYTRTQLDETVKMGLTIAAGYNDLVGLVFSGRVERVIQRRTATGWETTISGTDGLMERRRRVSVSLEKGATKGKALEKVLEALGGPARGAVEKVRAGDFLGALDTIGSGLTIDGQAGDVAERLARELGLSITIQSGEVQLLKAGETSLEEAVVLSPESGMEGSPEQHVDEKRPGALLVKVKSRLLPGLYPGRRVELQSVVHRGLYRALSCTHTGDTHGAPWNTESILTAL